MNIIYIGAFRLPNFDAAAPRVLNNAKIFRKLGHNVKFISWGGQYRNDDLCEDGRFRVCGFEYIISGDLPLNTTLWERILTKLTRGKRSIDLLKSMPKPDLIIVYNADNAFTKRMIRYCEKNCIKLANDINEWFDNNELHFQDILLNHINMTHTQHKVKNKIVISSFLYNYYPESNNILIPPLCDPEEPKWAAVVEDERVKMFKGITLIYAGNPGKKDCVHSVIDAVNTLAYEGEPIRFLILGISRESYMKAYSKFLKSTTLHDNVIFLGRVSQDVIPAYYRKADFMVLLRKPNRKSMAGFPTKFAESMTAGVPVITNATSDLPKYVINGKTGFLIDGYDYNNILIILRSILMIPKVEIGEMKSHVQVLSTVFDWHSRVADFDLFFQKLK